MRVFEIKLSEDRLEAAMSALSRIMKILQPVKKISFPKEIEPEGILDLVKRVRHPEAP